jgi:hypothetical protein
VEGLRGYNIRGHERGVLLQLRGSFLKIIAITYYGIWQNPGIQCKIQIEQYVINGATLYFSSTLYSN